ncbi:MAG: hypothetical protein WCP32_10320 [Bacteroidota bacterium]
MPIKPENKKRYPANWQEIRSRIQSRAKDKCEWCGVVNHSWINSKTRMMCLSDEENAIRVVCTVAHMDHTPENCADENLFFLCQKCHLKYDAPHRIETISASRLKGQIRIPFLPEPVKIYPGCRRSAAMVPEL